MFRDLTNKKFGKLTAIKIIGKNKKKESIWECQCDCGNISNVVSSNLSNGHTTSCGCYKKICSIKHNKLNTRLYRIWQNMKNRCLNPNVKKFRNYGARQICVCKDWQNDFMCFYNWAMNNGYAENLTIDRIDVNGNYEPSNCRWITNKEQCNNKTNNILIEYKNKTYTLKQWGEILGIKQQTLSQRYKKFKNNLEKLFYKGNLRYGRN